MGGGATTTCSARKRYARNEMAEPSRIRIAHET